MSTGLEVQVFLPVINAPFRVYWAYNPLRLDTYYPRSGPHHPRHVPAGGSGRLHFRAGLAKSCAPVSIAGTAQDISLQRGDDVLRQSSVVVVSSTSFSCTTRGRRTDDRRPSSGLTLSGGCPYNGNIHALKKAANGVVTTPLQVRREALGTPAQPLPLTANGRVSAEARPALACMKNLTDFPGQISKEFKSTT